MHTPPRWSSTLHCIKALVSTHTIQTTIKESPLKICRNSSAFKILIFNHSATYIIAHLLAVVFFFIGFARDGFMNIHPQTHDLIRAGIPVRHRTTYPRVSSPIVLDQHLSHHWRNSTTHYDPRRHTISMISDAAITHVAHDNQKKFQTTIGE
jgi:hypothetical protein